jgi:hypothetical protein
VNRVHIGDIDSFLFLPANSCWPFLFSGRAGALSLRRAASRIGSFTATLRRLSSAWLACLAVDPTLAIVAAEPLLEAIASCFCHCYPSSSRRLFCILQARLMHMRWAIWCSET